MSDTNIQIANNINKKIENARNIVIISSRPADQDCIGTALTLKWYIQEQFGKTARTIIFSAITDRLNNFPHAKTVEFINATDFNPAEYDLLIVVDGSTWERVFTADSSKNFVEELDFSRVAGIDHHVEGELKKDLKDNFLHQKDCCTAKLVYDYFIKPAKLEVTPEVATWIYFALIDDTKRFTHELYEDTYLFANEIYALGADHALATDEVSALEGIKFTARAIEHTEFLEDIESTILAIDPSLHAKLAERFGKNWHKKDYERHYVETIMRKIKGFNYGLLFQQDTESGSIRVGWRTRAYGDHIAIFDVLKAIGFEGGGHFGSGGARIEKGDLSEIKDKFIAEMKKRLLIISNY